MKRALKLTITGNMQSMFFKQFIKENADANNIKGFMRNLEGGKVEIFIEGNSDDVAAMASVCKIGPKFTTVRSVEEKRRTFPRHERIQDTQF